MSESGIRMLMNRPTFLVMASKASSDHHIKLKNCSTVRPGTERTSCADYVHCVLYTALTPSLCTRESKTRHIKVQSRLKGPQIPPTMVCGGPTSKSFTSPGKLTMTVPSTPKKAHGTYPVFSTCTWLIDSTTFVGVHVCVEGTVMGHLCSVASINVMVTAGLAG